LETEEIKENILIGLILFFFKLLYFLLTPWGNVIAPITLPLIVTISYALWSRNVGLSFLVGFWSMMATLMRYYGLPPERARYFIPLVESIMFGLLGVSIAFISKKAGPKKSIVTILIGIILVFATGGLFLYFGIIPLYIGLALVIGGIIMVIIEDRGIIRAIAVMAVVIVSLLTFAIPKWTPLFYGLPSWLNLPLLTSPLIISLIISLLILARIVLQTLDRLESPTWRPFLIVIILGINAIVLWIILRIVVIVLWYV